MKRIVVSALWIVLAAFAVSAQDEEPGKNELMVWGGYAPAVRTFEVGGRTWSGRLGIGALRYSHRFNNSDWVNLKYTLDASIVVLNYPDKIVTGTTITPVRETKYAIGLAPIGLQGNFRPRKKSTSARRAAAGSNIASPTKKR
jgi:opacity protein-like surface antigen